MVKMRIAWSTEARLDLIDILEFYVTRNGNSNYSRKLYTRINKDVKQLAKKPLIGRITDIPNIRTLITGGYQIIYEVFDSLILIIMIWDCRRDPKDKVINTGRI